MKIDLPPGDMNCQYQQSGLQVFQIDTGKPGLDDHSMGDRPNGDYPKCLWVGPIQDLRKKAFCFKPGVLMVDLLVQNAIPRGIGAVTWV